MRPAVINQRQAIFKNKSNQLSKQAHKTIR